MSTRVASEVVAVRDERETIGVSLSLLTTRGSPWPFSNVGSALESKTTQGPSKVIPGVVLRNRGRSWSHIVGIYRKKLSCFFGGGVQDLYGNVHIHSVEFEGFMVPRFWGVT